MSEPRPPHLPYATPTTLSRGRGFGKLFGWALFITLAVLIFAWMQGRPSLSQPYGELPLSEFHDLLAAGEIVGVVVEDHRLVSETRTIRTSPAGVPLRRFYTKLPIETSRQWTFMQWLLAHRNGAIVRVENDQNLLLNIIIPLIPWMLIFGFVWFVVFRQMRRAGGTAMWPVAAVPVQPAATPVAAPVPEQSNETR